MICLYKAEIGKEQDSRKWLMFKQYSCSVSLEVVTLVKRFPPAWEFSATNSCSYFSSNLEHTHKKNDHPLSSYHAKKNLVFSIKWLVKDKMFVEFEPYMQTIWNPAYLRHWSSLLSVNDFLKWVEGKKRTNKLHIWKHKLTLSQCWWIVPFDCLWSSKHFPGIS